MNRRCEENDFGLSLLVDGNLDELDRFRLEAHLQGCERCRGEKLRLEDLKALAASLPVEEAPSELWQRIEARLDADAAPRRRPWRAPVLLALAAGLALLLARNEMLLDSRRPPESLALQPDPADLRLRGSASAKARLGESVLLLGDPDEDVRAAAAESLGLIGPAAKPAIPALIGALHDSSAEVRALAAQALGKLGVEARAAAGPLRELHDDPDESVRAAAAAALGKLE